MANTSILAAFDRMWQHVVAIVSNKSDQDHNHDDMYYTEAEMDYKLDTVNASITNITNGTIPVAKAEEANHATSSDTASSAISATSATKATQDANGNVITSTYETKTDATAKLDSAKSYTDSKVSGLASTSIVDNKISAHNTSTSAHNDIRDLINGLTTRLNTLADSDDITLDQMSEVVAYIKSNKNLIDSITTSKVSVSDIVDNLTTNVTNKPLSAAQGVAIKSLIDALQIELDAHGHDIVDVSGLQTALDGKANTSHNHDDSYYTKPEMDGTLSSISSSVAYIDEMDNEDIVNPDIETSSVIIDSALSTSSTNPVQNKVITAELRQLSSEIANLKVDIAEVAELVGGDA